MEQTEFTSMSSSKVVEYNVKNLNNLVFEVTDACNLRCKYCGYAEFYQGYDLRQNSFLSFDKAKVLIDYLANIWRNNRYEGISQPLTVGFYGGEPLMNIKFIKQTIDYFDNIKDVGKRFRYNMTTNAMLLDSHMDYIVEKDMQLLISLDGDEEGHSYRVDTLGNNSFRKVINNGLMVKKRDEIAIII